MLHPRPSLRRPSQPITTVNSTYPATLAALAALLAVATLAGCAGSAPRPDLPVVGRFASAERGSPFVPDVPALDPTSATAVTLDELLAYADRHSPAVLVARSRVGLADAEGVEAAVRLPANPELSFGAGGRTVDAETGFELEVAIAQQLEIAGEPALRAVAAEDRRRLALAAVDSVRWSVHVEVHRLFVDVLLMGERIAQAERFVAFSQSMREIAARQVEAGESSPLILLVADADLAQTREAVVEARRLEGELRVQLAAVVGWPEPYLPPLAGELPALLPALDPDALVASMIANHPALRASELAVSAGHSRLALADREAWPEPTIALSYGREAAPGPAPEAHVWLVGLSLPIPLWHTNQGDRARAEAEVHVADRERTETLTNLRSELLRAALALDAARERVALYETGVVPQLESNLALLQRAYELGEVDVHQVSQTRERLLTATGQYLDARVAYFETAARLEGLVGSELWETVEDAR